MVRLLFATQALKSTQVLDTANHPFTRFRSTRVRLGPGGRLSDGASLEGDLTLRGITRRIRFEAGLFRPRGSQPDQLDRLEVRLRTTISRAAFKATGYANLVGDSVELDIWAEISAMG